MRRFLKKTFGLASARAAASISPLKLRENATTGPFQLATQYAASYRKKTLVARNSGTSKPAGLGAILFQRAGFSSQVAF